MANDEKIKTQTFGATERHSHWYLGIVALFITTLITANIISVKLVYIVGLVLPAGILVFPLSYIIGDVLTEVYGYSSARRVIWLGFLCNFIAVIAILSAQGLPPAPFWDGQQAYEKILGYAPRLLAASFTAYLAGEFFNAYILARMKILTKGRWLWSRTIGSTLVGQGVDSMIFISLAFIGTMPFGTLVMAIVVQWLAKSAYEAAATPLTYMAVIFLKRKEKMDVYDHNTRFNPFRIRT
ncbi:queuosine precursor transporter [Thermodesulfobacteriota bacterium]